LYTNNTPDNRIYNSVRMSILYSYYVYNFGSSSLGDIKNKIQIPDFSNSLKGSDLDI